MIGRRHLLTLLVAAAGCGGAPAPETAEPGQGAPPSSTPGCGATCDEVSLRGPLAVAPVSDDGVCVVARSPEGPVVLGVARVEGGRWNSRSLSFAPVDLAPEQARDLSLVAVPGGAVLAVATEQAVIVMRVDAEGDPTELASIDAALPTRLASAASPDGSVALAWLDPDGGPGGARIDPEGEVKALDLGLPSVGARSLALAWDGSTIVAAAAGQEGVAVRAGGTVTVVSEEPATGVALLPQADALVVAWTSAAGVVATTVGGGAAGPRTTVDDGRRPGEPAHRVGAGLILASTPEGWIAAYQDQTAGALAIRRAGGVDVERAPAPRARHTRAMHVAAARLGDRVFVLDLGARTTPEVVMTPFVTPVGLR